MIYERIVRPTLFLFDPEFVHDGAILLGEMLGRTALGRGMVRSMCHYEHPALRTTVRGTTFPNPIGLAAGFDKDVRLTNIMPSVGVGFMEVGAITYHAYGGNKGTRLVRLKDDKALVVYYGLKNIGADAVAEKMKHLSFAIPTGINIAKTNRADVKGAASVEDYCATYRMLAGYFAYATLNVSCPNAQDGCLFQDPRLLNELLAGMAHEKKRAPIFLKISNHLSIGELDDILEVVDRYPFIDGFVVTNLSKKREQLQLKSSERLLGRVPEGGISGLPIKHLSTRLIRHIAKTAGDRYAIMGVGGVFTGEDAYEKIKAGASLIQLITGMIYGGPFAIKRIKKELVGLLHRDGFKSVEEAVGIEAI